MVTFDIKGKNANEKAARRDAFISRLSGQIDLVPTLGDCDTILLPVEPVWGDKYPLPGMIRFSAGIEDTDQLIKTVKEVLDSI